MWCDLESEWYPQPMGVRKDAADAWPNDGSHPRGPTWQRQLKTNFAPSSLIMSALLRGADRNSENK